MVNLEHQYTLSLQSPKWLYRYIHERIHSPHYGEKGTSKQDQDNTEILLLTVKKTNPPRDKSLFFWRIYDSTQWKYNAFTWTERKPCETELKKMHGMHILIENISFTVLNLFNKA